MDRENSEHSTISSSQFLFEKDRALSAIISGLVSMAHPPLEARAAGSSFYGF